MSALSLKSDIEGDRTAPDGARDAARMNAFFAVYAVGDQDVVLASDYDALSGRLKKLNSKLIKEKSIADLERTVMGSKIAEQALKLEEYAMKVRRHEEALQAAISLISEFQKESGSDSKPLSEMLTAIKACLSRPA